MLNKGIQKMADRDLVIDFTQAPTQVSLNTSSQKSGQLQPGWYIISATEDATVLQGGSGVTALSSSHPLKADVEYKMPVNGSSDAYVAGIVGSGTATLSICKARLV